MVASTFAMNSNWSCFNVGSKRRSKRRSRNSKISTNSAGKFCVFEGFVCFVVILGDLGLFGEHLAKKVPKWVPISYGGDRHLGSIFVDFV